MASILTIRAPAQLTAWRAAGSPLSAKEMLPHEVTMFDTQVRHSVEEMLDYPNSGIRLA
jgi:hypothetical protein